MIRGMSAPAAPPAARVRGFLLRHAPLGLAWLVVLLAFLKAFDVVILSDPSNYIVEARQLLEHGPSRLLSGESRTAPGFPLILAGSIAVGGLFAPYFVNLFFCLALITAAWIWFRRLFAPMPAAGSLAVLCWILFASTPVVPTYMIHPFREPSTLACCFAALALITRRSDGPVAPWREPVAAMLLLAGAGIRETVLLLLPGITAWILFNPVGERISRIRRLGWFLLPWCLAIVAVGSVLFTRGAWSNQTGQVLHNLGNYSGADGVIGARVREHLPQLLAYARGMTGHWLLLLIPGALLALGRQRLWLITWLLVLPQAGLILLLDVFPRYVVFVLVWMAPWCGAALTGLASTQLGSRISGRWRGALAGLALLAAFAPSLVRLERLPASPGWTNAREIRDLRVRVESAVASGWFITSDPLDRIVDTIRNSHLMQRWGDENGGWLISSTFITNHGLEFSGVWSTEKMLLLTGAKETAFLRMLKENHSVLPAEFSVSGGSGVVRLWSISNQWTRVVSAPIPAPDSAEEERLLWVRVAGRSFMDNKRTFFLFGSSGGDAFGSHPLSIVLGDAEGQVRFPAGNMRAEWRVVSVPAGKAATTLTLRTPEPLLLDRLPQMDWARPGEWHKLDTGSSFATDAMLFADGGEFDLSDWLNAGGIPRFSWPKLELAVPGVLGWTNGLLGVSLLCTARHEFTEPGNFWCEWGGEKIPGKVGKGLPAPGQKTSLRLTWRLPVRDMQPVLPVRLFTDNGRMDRNPLRVDRIDVNWDHLPADAASPP